MSHPVICEGGGPLFGLAGRPVESRGGRKRARGSVGDPALGGRQRDLDVLAGLSMKRTAQALTTARGLAPAVSGEAASAQTVER